MVRKASMRGAWTTDFRGYLGARARERVWRRELLVSSTYNPGSSATHLGSVEGDGSADLGRLHSVGTLEGSLLRGLGLDILGLGGDFGRHLERLFAGERAQGRGRGREEGEKLELASRSRHACPQRCACTTIASTCTLSSTLPLSRALPAPPSLVTQSPSLPNLPVSLGVRSNGGGAAVAGSRLVVRSLCAHNGARLTEVVGCTSSTVNCHISRSSQVRSTKSLRISPHSSRSFTPGDLQRLLEYSTVSSVQVQDLNSVDWTG